MATLTVPADVVNNIDHGKSNAKLEKKFLTGGPPVCQYPGIFMHLALTLSVVLVLRLPPGHRHPQKGFTKSVLQKYHGRRLSHHETLGAILGDIEKDSTQKGPLTNSVLKYLLPFLEIIQLECLQEVTNLRGSLRRWNNSIIKLPGSIDMTEHDRVLSSSWYNGRAMIKCF